MAMGLTEVMPIMDQETGRRAMTICHEDQGRQTM